MRRRLTIAILLLVAATVVVTTLGSFFFVRRAAISTTQQELAGQARAISTTFSGRPPEPGHLPSGARGHRQGRRLRRHRLWSRLNPDGSIRGHFPPGITSGQLDVPALQAGDQVGGHTSRCWLYSAVPTPLARSSLRARSWWSPARSTTRPTGSGTSAGGRHRAGPGRPGGRGTGPSVHPSPGGRGGHHPAHRLGRPRRHRAGDAARGPRVRPAGRVDQHHGGQPGPGPGPGAPVPPVRLPRAAYPADLDPWLRRRRGRRGHRRPRGRGRGHQRPRPTGWSGWSRTCWTWPDWMPTASPSTSGPSTPPTVVRQVADGFRPRAAELGLELDTAPGSDGPMWVEADADRLAQVVANLVENASSFARHRVVVGAGMVAGSPAVWVADDGPGIAAAELALVFERHFSLRPGRRPAQGIGTRAGHRVRAGRGHGGRRPGRVDRWPTGRDHHVGLVPPGTAGPAATDRLPPAPDRSAGRIVARTEPSPSTPREMPMGDVVLVTGASAGIGRACADRLHDRGWTVVGASRRGTWPRVAGPRWSWTSTATPRSRRPSTPCSVRARPARRRRGLRRVGSGRGGGAARPWPMPRTSSRPTSGARCGWSSQALPAMRRQGRGPDRPDELHRRHRRHPVPGLLQRQQVRHGGVRRGAGLRGGSRSASRSPWSSRATSRTDFTASAAVTCAGRRRRRLRGGDGQGGRDDGRGRAERGAARRTWPSSSNGCSRPDGLPGGSRWASSTSGSGSWASACCPTASSRGRPRVASASDRTGRSRARPKEAAHGQSARSAGARGRTVRPPDPRHLRHGGGQRPVVDREGLCHGGPPGRRASSSASAWASTPTATCSTGTPGCRGGRSRSPSGAAAGSSPSSTTTSVGPIRYEVLEPMKRVRFSPRPQRLPAAWPSTGSIRPCCRRPPRSAPTSGPRSATGSVPTWSATTRSGRRRAGWRSTGSARRSTPTSGCRPATTRGASATTWGRRRPTSTRSTRWPRWTSR